ncbi:uncharacterized protein LOC121547260 [Coregonus clupeaformis]|uniref:uncharacterized protein LOC121547260 n=1 Tax=Coregonus clupeaformis TaxID=59861 RepID=UPI001BE04199|nr:uncharacterized protein LOC121547260 [Coregonus clupeaformis]
MEKITEGGNKAKEEEEEEIKALKKEVKQLKVQNQELTTLHVSAESLASKTRSCAPASSLSGHCPKPGPSAEGITPLGISNATLQACGRVGTSSTAMVKDLAVAVFGREVIATHGLSGKTGNANKGTSAKPALDEGKDKLIIETVQDKFPDIPPKFIRAALREKMNDEHTFHIS